MSDLGQQGGHGLDLVAEERRRYFATQQALNNALWSVCDILRRSHCAGAMQYIPELTWILFLRILDEREQEEAAAYQGRERPYSSSLQSPFRWQDWAAPSSQQRRRWQQERPGAALSFINGSLIPHLRSLGAQEGATARQRIISEVFSGIERSRIGSDADLLGVLNKIHAIELNMIDATHVFALSQVYEGLLLRMGEKANDGGQFFTPREITRVMADVIAPRVGETVYDPCCGTGGFLAQAYEHMQSTLNGVGTDTQLRQLKQATFYGREKENLIYPIALANLVLHGIDEPHIWHGNTLADEAVNAGLFQEEMPCFDVILTNPPFGGKERDEVKQRFTHKTSATQILFLQHVIESLKPGGRCGIVLDEGVLFRTSESAFLQTKRMLLEQCDLWCIVSLPEGVFMAAGALVKTNLLFFTKGHATERTWYYDLSDVKVGKKAPLTRDKFDDFFRLLPSRGDSSRSWSVSRREMEERGYDLKAVNPTGRDSRDSRSRRDLLDMVQANNTQIAGILEDLRREVEGSQA